MFAAATREVVFSNPAVVEQINADFIPVALKAATVDAPPPGPEGDLYRAIRSSRAAPQGICTLNSAGHVLAWALSFQDESKIPLFFEHVKARYRAAADQPIYAERFRRFPTTKLPDVPAARANLAIPPRPAAGQPGIDLPRPAKGGLAGTIIGRRLDPKGEYVSNTRRQENYMEARVDLPPAFPKQLIALANHAGGKVELPDNLGRAIVAPAYLGQLDVNPLGVRRRSEENRVREWRFVARKTAASDSSDSFTIQLSGTSHVEGGHRAQPNGPTWDHVVELSWQGFAQIEAGQMTRLVLTADGTEKLKWGNVNLLRTKEPEAEHLMAGHAIDFNARVRYALSAEVSPARRE